MRARAGCENQGQVDPGRSAKSVARRTLRCNAPLMSSIEHTGHCLCGRTHYRAKGDPAWSCYCHCESCRRATGAPVTAYAGFPITNFTFEGEAPGRYESSPG